MFKQWDMIPVTNYTTVKGGLSQSAQTSHTQLAHALVQYLGVEAPTDLENYGIRSAGDLVDLISRVSRPKIMAQPISSQPAFKVLNKHSHTHDSKSNANRACSLTGIVIVQPLVRAKCCLSFPWIA